jgi:hypothetical protein
MRSRVLRVPFLA